MHSYTASIYCRSYLNAHYSARAPHTANAYLNSTGGVDTLCERCSYTGSKLSRNHLHLPHPSRLLDSQSNIKEYAIEPLSEVTAHDRMPCADLEQYSGTCTTLLSNVEYYITLHSRGWNTKLSQKRQYVSTDVLTFSDTVSLALITCDHIPYMLSCNE